MFDVVAILIQLVFAAVFLYVLWGVIRSAVLSALRKHAAEQAEVSRHSGNVVAS